MAGLAAIAGLDLAIYTQHRVHHSVVRRETDSNFGFNFPWWDRLFTTYRAKPEAGHLAMTIGLANCRDPRWLKLHWMLLVPVVRADL